MRPHTLATDKKQFKTALTSANNHQLTLHCKSFFFQEAKFIIKEMTIFFAIVQNRKQKINFKFRAKHMNALF